MKLYEYLALARKIVYKNYRKYSRDEEFIGEIANALIMSDLKYNPTYSRSSFRKRCIKHKALNLITKSKKENFLKKAVYNNLETIIHQNELREVVSKLEYPMNKVTTMFLDGYDIKEISLAINNTDRTTRLYLKKSIKELKRIYDCET